MVCEECTCPDRLNYVFWDYRFVYQEGRGCSVAASALYSSKPTILVHIQTKQEIKQRYNTEPHGLIEVPLSIGASFLLFSNLLPQGY